MLREAEGRNNIHRQEVTDMTGEQFEVQKG